MATQRKRARRTKKKPVNAIDKVGKSLRGAASTVKNQVAGSKEVQGATKSIRGAANKITGPARKKFKASGVGKKASGLVESAKKRAKSAKATASGAAGSAKTAAVDAAGSVKNAATGAVDNVKAATGGSAAKANARIRSRSAGPQQRAPVKDLPLNNNDRVAPNQKETPRQRAQTRSDIDRGVDRPAVEQPKQSLKRRALNKTGRGLRKVGGPAAVAAGAEGLIRFASDVSRPDVDVGDAIGERLNDAGEGLSELPEAAADFGRQAINRPIRTGLGVGAGVLDTAANFGLTAGDAGKALFQEGEFADNFDRNQNQTRSLRDPFGRALNAISPLDGEPGTAAGQAGADPLAPTTPPPEAGAGSQTTKVGLNAARSNREFIADKAKGFRTGLDVLQENNTAADANGNANLAAYGAASGIAKQSNAVEQASRDLNIDEAKAGADIRAQESLTGLRGAQGRAADTKTSFAFNKQVSSAREEGVGILEKISALQGDTGMFGGQSSENSQKIKDLQDTSFSQALNTGFDPTSGASVAAGQILTKEITPLMDPGIMSRVANAISSSDFSAADILNDNGELAVNRETINLMAVGGEEGDTVFMTIPRQDGQTETIPLFSLGEIQDPNVRSHFAKILGSGQGQQTLRDANR